MTIASRTPEGRPNCCPICGAEICLEPSEPMGDAPCPACGHLLWFARLPEGIRYFEHEKATDVAKRFAVEMGIDPDTITDPTAFLLEEGPKMGIDSLDIMELIMELEEEGRE